MNAKLHFILASCLILVLSAGCASTKVSDETRPNAPDGAPSMIYVGKFDLGQAKFKSDPGTFTGRPRLIDFGKTDPAKKLKELSDLLANTIVSDLDKAHFSAERLADDAALPADGWLVAGRFMEVVEGNRMQSAVIGFGVGGSDAKLYVIVRDLSRAPGQQDLLSLHADVKGNKAPGGGAVTILTHTPYGMAAKFVLDRDASEKDIKRTAHEISKHLEQLAAQSQPAQ